MADALNLGILAPRFWQTATFSATLTTVDATTDGAAWSFESPDEIAITHLGFRYGARTGTPPVYIIALEAPSVSTGFPDGTVLGGGSPASATFTPPADTTWDGTWQWVALANAYTPSRGQKLCATIRYSSGTVDGSNFSTFTRGDGAYINVNNPVPIVLTAGTWAYSNVFPIFGVRTASTRYGNIYQSTYVTRSASTVGHRQAMAFTLPSTWASTFTVKGIRFIGSPAGATGKAPVFGLWSASSVLQNNTKDSDLVAAATSTTRVIEWYFDESTLTDLSFGTKYYVGLEVADAANGGVIMCGIQLASADDLVAYPGGSNVHLATYNGSAWSDDQTVRPYAELILADITAPSGGAGGMIVHPGMSGRIAG